MKRIKNLLLAILVLPLCLISISVFAVENTSKSTEPSLKDNTYIPSSYTDPRNEEGKHLILNSNGSYGGSLHELKYGKGSPFNGEYDINNSEYYMRNDFFNMYSNENKTMYSYFSPYQQTMQDTSGIASVLMVLNYLGEKYSELDLVKKYEELNNTTIFGNGTTASGLKKLVDSLGLGYTTDSSSYKNPGTTRAVNEPAFVEWMQEQIREGKFVITCFCVMFINRIRCNVNTVTKNLCTKSNTKWYSFYVISFFKFCA